MGVANIIHEHRADRLIGGDQRHDEQGAAAEARLPIGRDARVVRHVVYYQGLTQPARIIEQFQLARRKYQAGIDPGQRLIRCVDGANAKIALRVTQQDGAPIYAGERGHQARHLIQRGAQSLRDTQDVGDLEQQGGKPGFFLACSGQPGVVHGCGGLLGDAGQHGDPPFRQASFQLAVETYPQDAERLAPIQHGYQRDDVACANAMQRFGQPEIAALHHRRLLLEAQAIERGPFAGQQAQRCRRVLFLLEAQAVRSPVFERRPLFVP